jgi:proteasome lid subunit RPN8/RPN11
VSGDGSRRLKSAAFDDIVEYARRQAPHECCGMLIGTAGDVLESVRARNIADRPAVRFLIDPHDHVRALRSARARGLDVVGFYHSHPRSAAVPSETDLAEATYADQLLLIVSLQHAAPDLRLYWFRDGNFLAVPFVTVA